MKWYHVISSILVASILQAKTLYVGGDREVRVRDKSATGMVVSIGVDKLNYGTYELGGKVFTRFYLKDKDIGETAEVGKPNLPVIRRFFEVPVGAEVTFNVLSYEKDEISLKEAGMEHPIMPSYPPVPKIKGAVPQLVIDKNVYESDEYWPRNVVNIKPAGNIRGHELYVIEYFPVRYNPVSEKIEIIKNITLKINYEGGNIAYTMSSKQRKYSPPFEKILRKRVINYELFETKLNPQLPITYLVITPVQYLDSLQSFITWKKQIGYHVHVATIPDSIPSGDTLTVKQYIQDAYDNWTNPPTFVLLVGDVGDIGNWNSTESDNPANDLGYALLEGTDYLPDVYIGRFSATTDSMVGVIVRKVVTYEKTLWGADTAWAQKAFFIASADPSNHGVAEGTHNYCIGIVRGYDMFADSLYAYYTSNAPDIITNTLNEGRSLVTYSGHGSETGWADYSDLQYSVSDIYNNLTNGVKTPFLQTYACLTGSYTQSECFMEAWLRAPDKGAAASMGSSVTSYWEEDDILQRRLFDEIFDSGYVWVMGAINAAKLDFYAHYGDNTSSVTTLRYFQMYNLFGDPSMYLYTHVPYEFTVSHDPTIPIGTVNFNVSVSNNNGPVEGALVSAVQNGNLLDAKYTDGTGIATLEITTSVVDSIYITVTAYNHKPYVGAVIPSSEGPYVSLVSSEIVDTFSGCNNNGRINPGETITLKALLKNWGQDTAYDVQAILVSSDTLVSISQDSAFYGTISPGDSVLNTEPYVFNVSSNASDGDILNFQLVITFKDSNGVEDTTVSNLSYVVYAPYVVAGEITVIDTFAGDNNDYVAQPGEIVDVVFSARNVGHEDILSVSADLSTSDPYLTINTGSANYGDIPVDSSALPDTPFNISIDSTCPDGYEAELYVTFTGDGYTMLDTVRLFIGSTGYYTDVEDSAQIAEWSMDNPWHVSSRRYFSASHSFYFGDEASGEYPSNANASLVSPVIKIGPNAKLSFRTWFNLEDNYDYGYVEYSVDSGANWTQLYTVNGESGGWMQVVIDLSSISTGSEVMIRFRGTSDGSVQREGWYVDNIKVTPPEIPTLLTIGSIEVVDTLGNNSGTADPGEEITLVINLMNAGDTAFSVSGLLRSVSEHVIVIDSLHEFGNICPDTSMGGYYGLQISNEANPLGEEDTLLFIVAANGGAYSDTIEIVLNVGDIRHAHTGPDSYGYYIYDLYDVCTEAPSYEWVEINGVGTVVADGDDNTQTISLPFTFRYYGTDYNQISICSNGWIGFGSMTSTTYSNTDVPNSSEPNNIVAPLWDDLNPTDTGSGKIYYYYDTTNNRVIIEWDSVAHYGGGEFEKFEVILYDPQYYPTRTGDGEIVVQYKLAPQQTDFTTGLENADGTVGIRYVYDDVYDEYAFNIEEAFAIKMTTDTPVYVGVSESPAPMGPTTFSLIGNFPNPFSNQTIIRFAVPRESNVQLSVYDISGRKVATLMSGKVKRGYYSVTWNGKDSRGRRVKSGVYFYVLRADKFRKTRKMIMIR